MTSVIQPPHAISNVTVSGTTSNIKKDLPIKKTCFLKCFLNELMHVLFTIK